MKYKFYESPVTFCIISDFYSDDEVQLIHEELDRLDPHLGGAEKTGTAHNVQGGPKKKNKGLFLNDFYGLEERRSSILNLNRKLFDSKIQNELQKGNWFFKYIERTKHDSTLVSRYSQGDYYYSHVDESFITAIYYTWKEPKAFEGGDIFFGDFQVPIENNCFLIFPSCTEHSVSAITKGSGRYAITQFINYERPPLPQPNIRRFTNFLTVNEFDKAWSLVNNSMEWSNIGTSDADPPPGKKTGKFGFLNLLNVPFFTDHLVKKICQTVGMNLQLGRVYANGQVFGQDGGFHQDQENAPDGNFFTFLVYMNKVEDVDAWGGETQFKFYDDKLTVYQPETNSALLFDSTLWHRGLGPSRFVDEMRVTIAWKFKLVE